ncbi:inositol monophosphatase family protein [Micrococcoides hystricis]|uniref:Inositol-1-monophosphatase n=1 Tax=Micrococcoides hystricis TaxID=1572761 RepID=A0ABV6P813_9MICC
MTHQFTETVVEFEDQDVSPEILREVAEEAVRLAGSYVLEAFREQMVVAHKRDRHDLVTEHDRASEKIITEFLLRLCPQWRIVGEEDGLQGGDPTVTWFIDPIDGTSNFAQGLAFFCISVGVEVDGTIVAGAVYNPFSEELFTADDTGAYLNGKLLRAPTAQPQDSATLLTGYPSARDLTLDGSAATDELGQLIAAFSSVRRTGSGALSLCHVAAGWTDATIGFSTHPWDVAAASLIVHRAGGSYRPIWLDKTEGAGAHLAPGYVALAPGANYPLLEQIVSQVEQRRQRATAKN